MNIRYLYAAALLPLVLLSAALVPACAEDRPFIIAGDEDEAPFGYFNERREFCGFYVDLMKELFARLHQPLRHTGYPWARAQMMVKEGEADAMITVYTDARKEFTLSNSQPIVTQRWVAFTLAGGRNTEAILSARKLSDFKPFKVLDYNGDGWGETNLKGLNVYRSGSYSQQILKLINHRGDVFIQMDISTRFIISQLKANPRYGGQDFSSIVEGRNTLDERKFHLLVSKKSPFAGLLPRIDRTLREMRDDGTYARLLAKNGMQ